jgi:hypothetical protein
MPTYGEIFGQGIKYIKVNRFDSGGLDRSDYLGQLTNLTITYDDLGPIEYTINTTQEQNDYFIYGIQTKFQSTSSVNYRVLDYSWFIESSSAFSLSTVSFPPTNVTLLGGNSLGYFNTTSGYWDLDDTPNQLIQIQISGNATWNVPAGGPLVQVFNNNTNEIIQQETLTGIITGPQTNYPFNITLTLSSSYYSPIENDSISFRFRRPGAGTYTINKLWISASILSASVNPATSSLVIFDPEFIDFEYNDYNALFGNAETPQFSFQLMDVDYTTDFAAPVNFDLIISGTADRAQVQDSNYSSYAWSGLRYWGSRYNSFLQPQSRYDFLRGFIFGDFNDISTDGSGLGALPAVEQNQTFIAYFDGVGGTGPELIGQTAYFIKYLVDTNANISNPEPGVNALYNLIDNFEPGKNAIVRLIGSDPTTTSNPNDDSLVGLHPITHVGRISPILITETGSGNLDYIPTMSFTNAAGVALAEATQDLVAKFQSNLAATPISNTDWITMPYQNDLYSTNWSNNPNTPSFVNWQLNNYSTNQANTRIRLKVSFFVRKNALNPFYGFTNQFQFRILKNSDQSNVFFTSQWWEVDNTNGWYAEAWTEWFDTEEDDYFTVQFRVANSGPSTIQILGTAGGISGTTLTVEQETPSNNGFINGETGATSSYWSIGTYTTGSEVTVLTGSNALYNLYTAGDLKQITPTASSAFGFTDITLPFEILPGDYIRFQYNENRKHCITDVSTLNGLHLTVVPPVATSSILDHFIVYRVVNDGTYVVLNVDKPVSGSSFTGIIQPEYVSQELTDKYSDIIQDLTQRGLIS